ncbi:unnamed protein product, partial [Coregonus sp. 'balchen']
MSVWTGDSIAIPCTYHQDYINHVKYWCKGHSWNTCSYVVRTDHPNSSGKTSISDAINLRTFTMAMKSLEQSDCDIYWCVVEKNGPDEWIELFKLVITVLLLTKRRLALREVVFLHQYQLFKRSLLYKPQHRLPSPSSTTHTMEPSDKWERTLFYLPKTVNAVLFFLCTIMAVVKFRTNRLR